MAHIQKFPLLRHLRSEQTSHVVVFRAGKPRRSGRGLAFWFHPLQTSVAEIPLVDLEQTFLFKGRSADFQEVSVQGSITYRVAQAELLSSRIDFSIDLNSGQHSKEPLEKVSGLLSNLASQMVLEYIAPHTLETLLIQGLSSLRSELSDKLGSHASLKGLGLEIVSVQVAHIRPSAEVEKALQTPTREAIQQQADQATFERRALAVEKERAIQENELQNRIELAKREEQFIAQQGQNERRRASEAAEAGRIGLSLEAERTRVSAEAQAEGIRQIEIAKAEGEQARMNIYRELPQGVLMALAFKELAGNLPEIQQLNLTPDMVSSLIGKLMRKEQ